MENTILGKRISPPATQAPTSARGRYLYGVADGGRAVSLGQIGIEGNEVYSIPYQELCAVVHACPAEPYQASDNEIVAGWVKTHQMVIDGARECFGTVIPSGFDTIIGGKDEAVAPDQMIQDWLREDYQRLCLVMARIRGRDEYVVQVSYDPDVISERIWQQSEEIRKIKEEIGTKPPGIAYLYRQKLEKVVRADMDRLVDQWFKDFYHRIKKPTEDIVVEKTKKVEKDKVMLLNFSCLVAKEKVSWLGEELEKINNMAGFSVHFSGPWPPYSFVAKAVVLTKGG